MNKISSLISSFLLLVLFLTSFASHASEPIFMASYTGFGLRAWDNPKTSLDPENKYINGNESVIRHKADLKLSTNIENVNFGLHAAFIFATKENQDKDLSKKVVGGLKQLYVGMNLGNGNLTLGRITRDWSKAYYRSPISLLEPDKRATAFDKINSIGLGHEAVEYEYYLGPYFGGIILGRENLSQFLLVRTNLLLGGLEVEVVAGSDQENHYGIGAGFTSVVASQVEFHGEGFYRHGAFFASESLYPALNDPHSFEGIIGTMISLELKKGIDTRWITEIFYDQRGLSPREWQVVTQDLHEISPALSERFINRNVRNERIDTYKQLTRGFNPEKLTQLGLFNALDNLPTPHADYRLRPIIIYGLQDGGVIAVVENKYQLSDQSYVFLDYSYYGGKKGSIYRNIPVSGQYVAGVHIDF